MVQTAFMFLAFLSLSSSALTVFYWFVNLTACGVLVSWISILYNHYRLISAMKKQSIPVSLLPWHNKWTAYSTPLALVVCTLILFTSGYTVFTKGNWSASSFVSNYLDIGLVAVAYLIWKYAKGTSFVKLEDIPIRAALDEIDRHPEEPEPTAKGWRKWVGCLWD